MNNIWNRIGKGKYKLSFHLWVGMWVRKKKLKDTYTIIHSQLVAEIDKPSQLCTFMKTSAIGLVKVSIS